MNYNKESLKLHKKYKGKLTVNSKFPIKTKTDLSLAYTPGVAAPSKKIFKNKKDAYKYTFKGNTVAVISDGSAVLGLGNIGAEAALPVMEGKCALLKEFANIDAFPICLSSQDVKTNIETIKNIAPVFGGIILEDIKAPQCFEIENALQDLGIPVMHDDQHGTATIVLAALMNSCKVVNKKLEDLTIIINGAGAAGIAITKLLKCINVNKKICTPVKEIIVVDSKGAIYKGRKNLNKYKAEIAKFTNKKKIKGKLSDVIKGTGVFIGVSKPNILKKEMVRSMNKPIIFALANPDPEILPSKAKKIAAIMATGRSDFPNQVNNILGFPGIFRGALDIKATQITNEMKIAAARAIASVIKPTKNKILPLPTNKSVVPKVAKAVMKAWKNEK